MGGRGGGLLYMPTVFPLVPINKGKNIQLQVDEENQRQSEN